MEYEIRFLDMLGYKTNQLYETRWEILDDNDKSVGFIQRKKLVNKNKKRGTPAVFGYITKIESDTISYSNARKDTEDELSYSFDVKKGNQECDHVEMNYGVCPDIIVWSKEYGFMKFGINYKGLHANFKSKTENYNTEEIIIFQNYQHEPVYHQEYTYQINYCDKNLSLDSDNNKNIKSRCISATSNFTQECSNKITLKTMTYNNNTLRYINEQEVDGTVDEVAVKNEMGIEAISHLRYRLNELSPFKKEVFGILLQNTPYLETSGTHLFFPDIIESRKSEGSKQKAKSIS